MGRDFWLSASKERPSLVDICLRPTFSVKNMDADTLVWKLLTMFQFLEKSKVRISFHSFNASTNLELLILDPFISFRWNPSRSKYENDVPNLIKWWTWILKLLSLRSKTQEGSFWSSEFNRAKFLSLSQQLSRMCGTKAYFLSNFYSSWLQQRSPNPIGHN